MTKLLVLVLILFVIYVVWRAVKRSDAAPPRPRAQSIEGERMVDCSQCGVHLPVSEAVESQGRFFCSEEHRRLYSR